MGATILRLTSATIAIACCISVGLRVGVSDENGLMLIPLPVEGQVCVMPADYQFPYTKRGMRERINTKQHLYRQNDEQGVVLSRDQVIGFAYETTGDLSFLDKVPRDKLRVLDVMAARITDEGIARLKRCNGLRHLSVGCNTVDNIEKVLGATPHLQYVGLASPVYLDSATADKRHFFTDKIFHDLAELDDLRSVGIVSPLLSDEALQLAARIPKLEAIDIREARLITDHGLKALVAAKHLREIVLQVGPKCTDDGVKELLKLEHLEWIEIQGMEKVEPATVEALKARFPDAHIEFKPRVSR